MQFINKILFALTGKTTSELAAAFAEGQRLARESYEGQARQMGVAHYNTPRGVGEALGLASEAFQDASIDNPEYASAVIRATHALLYRDGILEAWAITGKAQLRHPIQFIRFHRMMFQTQIVMMPGRIHIGG